MPRRTIGDCSNQYERVVGSDNKPSVHLRVRDDATDSVPRWTGNPFAPESGIFGLEGTKNAVFEVSESAPLTSWPNKLPLLAGSAPKPRPTPIYKDKQHEEYWSFLKSGPEIQTDQLPPLSRCPSLMSGGALSSRNSSTRSTRSSIWDPIEDPGACERSICIISKFLCSQNVSLHSRSPQSIEKPRLQCPMTTCDHHLAGFERVIDCRRHILKHFNGTLHCGFCTEATVSFSQAADRIELFLTHLIKKHGARGQYSDAERSNGKRERSMPGSSFEGPIANCSVCTEPFSAQGFYEHLPGCILREVTRNEDSHTGIDGDQLSHDDLSKYPNTSSESNNVIMPVCMLEEPHTNFVGMYDCSQPPSVEPPEVEREDIVSITMSSRCLSLTSSKAMESSEEETDWTEEQTSRESSPGASQVPRRLSPTKRRIVETVMQEFQRFFNQTLRTHATGGNSSGSSYSANSSWSSSASVYSTSSFVSRKRSLSGGGSTPPDDEEDESNKRRRPYNKTNGKKPATELRFACPYYKRNPGRHQTYTSCRDPGSTTVARLKEHLYRRHLLPPQCHRCCATFSNDVTLREHQRDPEGCEVHEQISLEGFDKNQERQLKSKKKSQVYLTEDEKWKGVYRILFPDDGEADIPTPYIEYQLCTGQVAKPSNVMRFQEFSRLELPRLVRRTLEVVVEQEAQPLEEKMKERLVDIVKECQNQLVSMFQAAGGPNVELQSSATLPTGILPPLSRTSTSIAGLSTRPFGNKKRDLFESFDTLPAGGAAASPAAVKSHLPMTVTMANLPASSNSSDSGYDSTCVNTGKLPFTVSSNSDHNEYIDLSTYSDFFENSLDATGPTSNSVPALTSMMDTDPFTWSFLEPLPGTSNSSEVGLNSLDILGSNWQI